MADKSHYNTDVKVPESVIEEIRKLGMAASLKKAESGGASKEFIEGVRRFYPGRQDIEADPKKRDVAGAKKLAESRANASKDKKSDGSAPIHTVAVPDSSSSGDNSSNSSRNSSREPHRTSTPGGEAAVARRLNSGKGKGVPYDPDSLKNSPAGKAVSAIQGSTKNFRAPGSKKGNENAMRRLGPFVKFVEGINKDFKNAWR